MQNITANRINQLKSSIIVLRSCLSFWFFSNKKSIKFDNSIINKKTFNEKKDSIKKTEISSRPVKNDEQNKSVNTDSDKNRLKIDDGKIIVMPGDCVVNQGDEGRSAFLILSGSFNVEIDKKVVGAMSTGEIFGELSLILGEKRKATIRAITGSELIEIEPAFLDDFLLTSKASSKKVSQSTLETQRIVREFAVELGKKNDHKISISKEDLIEVIKEQSDIVQCLALQLHKRLSRMISDQKKSKMVQTNP